MGGLIALLFIGGTALLLGVTLPIVRVVRRRNPMMFIVIPLEILPWLFLSQGSGSIIPITFTLGAILSFIGPDNRKRQTTPIETDYQRRLREANPIVSESSTTGEPKDYLLDTETQAQQTASPEVSKTISEIEEDFTSGKITRDEYLAARKKLNEES